MASSLPGDLQILSRGMKGGWPAAVIWLAHVAAPPVVASQDLRVPSAAAGQHQLAGIANYIEKARRQWEVPGLAVVVVKDDRIVMARGFGVREIGKPAPVDEYTIFALSSMGKAFAAAAVGVLVDEGRLGWDDLIVDHLPWFQMPDPWVTRQVTVRDLLAHRGGIGGLDDEIVAATRANPEEVVRRVRYLIPVSSFRSRYDYSNVGITTAGLAAAAAAGLDWHTLMRDRVLRPLRMDFSTTDLRDLWDSTDVAPCYLCVVDHPVRIEQSHHHNIVMPHVWEDGKVRPIPWRSVAYMAPAGSINSNAMDMAQWLRMQLGRGMYDGHRFLSEAAIAEMHTPQNIIRAEGTALAEEEDRFHFLAYGLGWRLNDYRGRKMIWHTGGIIGFTSIMALLPDANLGVGVLTNAWRGPADLLVDAIVLRIFDSYLGGAARDWSTKLLAASERMRARQEQVQQELEASRIPGTSPSLPLDAYAGTYVHPAYDPIAVAVRDDRLVVGFFGTLAGTLEHWHYDTFRVRWKSPTRSFSRATFSFDPQHRPVELSLEGFGKFRRVWGKDGRR